MNIRKVVTYNNLRRQFTPAEQTLADALYNVSEADRALLLESLQPQKAAKKSSKKSASKSPRAQSLASAIKGGLGGHLVSYCRAIGPNNLVCGEYEDANVHHLTTDDNYHPFQSAPPAGERSSPNNGETKSTASSATPKEGASSAAQGASGGD